MKIKNLESDRKQRIETLRETIHCTVILTIVHYGEFIVVL